MVLELEAGLESSIHDVGCLEQICLPQFPHIYKGRSKIFYKVSIKTKQHMPSSPQEILLIRFKDILTRAF